MRTIETNLKLVSRQISGAPNVEDAWAIYAHITGRVIETAELEIEVLADDGFLVRHAICQRDADLVGIYGGARQIEDCPITGARRCGWRPIGPGLIAPGATPA